MLSSSKVLKYEPEESNSLGGEGKDVISNVKSYEPPGEIVILPDVVHTTAELIPSIEKLVSISLIIKSFLPIL